MTEEPESILVTDAILYTPIPSSVEKSFQLGMIHQVSHSSSAQNPTEINLDAATLYLSSGEDHNVPS